MLVLVALVLPLGLGACTPRKAATSAPDPAVNNAPPKHDANAIRPSREHAGGAVVLLRGARVMTAAGTDYPKADVLLRGRRIAAVGVGLDVPAGATIIDLSGKTLTPGIIDTHSHLGVYAAPSFTAHADGNETVSPTTPQVRAEDGYWPQDPQIERARAGGVTTMQILPGSANLIGGRSVVVKTYPHARRVAEARFAGAPFGLKMACGENPKRVYGKKSGPATRMGNMAGFRAKFEAAKEYQRSWERYREKLTRSKTRASRAEDNPRRGHSDKHSESSSGPPAPPTRDFGLETMVGVLEGRILVHNHCYRADEMALMMQLADDYGFKIRSFHHAVEAYKIADLLAEHGAAASVWADWWGFKAEAFDGIRENAAMVWAAGARAIIHSDSAEGIQRLNQEAAKAMWAGRRAGLTIPDEEALRWITANAAWALGVQDQVGTIEVGKLADLVVWDGDPLSVYAHAQRVLIEGETVYQRGQLTPHSDFETGLLTATANASVSQTKPNPPQAAPAKPTTLVLGDGKPPGKLSFAGCTIHTGDGTVLTNATITTQGARIVAVSPAAEGTAADEATRPAQPCIITPGFIAAGSALGLVEISAEDGTKDDSRADKQLIRAGYDASVAVNADSSLLAINRIEGVTSAAVTPRGGLLAGQVAWIDLVVGEHRTIVSRRAIAVSGTLSTRVVDNSRAAALALLQRTFDDARFWRDHSAAYDRGQTRDLVADPADLAALLPIIDGKARLVVAADRVSDILALIDLARREKIALTITGAAQAHRVAAELAEAGTVVIVQPSRNLPGSLDRLGASMSSAAQLHAAGVTVAIAALGSAHNARKIAQEAGIAIAHGLPRDAAVQAVTLNVAKAYGMDGDYGSLQPGKVANFVVWRGDPFALSSAAQTVVIRGRVVPMTSRQTELRERYRDLSKFPTVKQ
ncbi:MAG: amidohydrolase family protein [Nannocystaceae bacterium]|nr:amidohydrolase family protein [Nannocystaceae bacterium]